MKVVIMMLCGLISWAGAETLRFKDRDPQRYQFQKRASELDAAVKSYPDIGFVLEDDKGKAQDTQFASVDTGVEPRGRLVIWLMGHNGGLAKELNAMGLHYLQVAYARQWFGKLSQGKKLTRQSRGNIRLEAATGEDHSDELDIAAPDSAKVRAYHMVKWLAEENPQGGWSYFLSRDGKDLDWEKVILSGISHGSTVAARWAKHTKVARVVAFSGPRDQMQDWQKLPSATPEERYFGFTHILDDGWKADHYCRSWELLGMNEFGPIVNVENATPPYGNTRRLITDYDVSGNSGWAHSAVIPHKKSLKTADGSYGHAAVWRYLFTHPVTETGSPVDPDDECLKDHWKK
ncbi:MAG: BPSS1187 family protein [Verrucomicrobiales bacterium]